MSGAGHYYCINSLYLEQLGIVVRGQDQVVLDWLLWIGRYNVRKSLGANHSVLFERVQMHLGTR